VSITFYYFYLKKLKNNLFSNSIKIMETYINKMETDGNRLETDGNRIENETENNGIYLNIIENDMIMYWKPIVNHDINDSFNHVNEAIESNLITFDQNSFIQMDTFNCICGIKYKNRSGLWKHKKKCSHNNNNEIIKINSEALSLTDKDENKHLIDANMLETFMTLMKQNQEFKELMIDQAKQTQDFQTQLLELTKEGRSTVINNNNTNNSFNLHVYLNETCKDAMNMLDYVNSLNLNLSDLEETGVLGYSNGMSRIFINGIKDMDVHLRPIHCSDLKREILYIKEDNVWEKDNENRDKIKNALRRIEKMNIMQIPLWIKAHPNCVISSNKDNTPYLNMVMQSTGGKNPAETEDMAKIITNIARAVVINK
jgi:hypothetical protein